jgi:hypothetical protein
VATVETVRGPVQVDNLGPTLTHEHIFALSTEHVQNIQRRPSAAFTAAADRTAKTSAASTCARVTGRSARSTVLPPRTRRDAPIRQGPRANEPITPRDLRWSAASEQGLPLCAVNGSSTSFDRGAHIRPSCRALGGRGLLLPDG